jgi:hypothetical protein
VADLAQSLKICTIEESVFFATMLLDVVDLKYRFHPATACAHMVLIPEYLLS